MQLRKGYAGFNVRISISMQHSMVQDNTISHRSSSGSGVGELRSICSLPFWYWNGNIPWEKSQYLGCWCSNFLHRLCHINFFKWQKTQICNHFSRINISATMVNSTERIQFHKWHKAVPRMRHRFMWTCLFLSHHLTADWLHSDGYFVVDSS